MMLHLGKTRLLMLLMLHEHSNCKNKSSPVGLLSLLLLLLIHVVWFCTESRDLSLHPSCVNKHCALTGTGSGIEIVSSMWYEGPKVSKSSVHDLAPASFSISSLLTCWARRWELIDNSSQGTSDCQWLLILLSEAWFKLTYYTYYININIIIIIYCPALLHRSNCALHKIPWHGDSMAETRPVSFFQIDNVFACTVFICNIHPNLVSVLVLTSSFSDCNAVNSFYRLLVLSHRFLFTARFCHMNAVQSLHAPATKAPTKICEASEHLYV